MQRSSKEKVPQFLAGWMAGPCLLPAACCLLPGGSTGSGTRSASFLGGIAQIRQEVRVTHRQSHGPERSGGSRLRSSAQELAPNFPGSLFLSASLIARYCGSMQLNATEPHSGMFIYRAAIVNY